ncbi:FUSC family protein [Neorhizobium alkalisoli]|uniref:Fusaric acid resistance family protein n=1 Tax=Neorhizobium alkalisoli TaxID=528178 RepID=A0A561R2W7_9HYPH|nr:FUSC family protein [Neorhizobium alkalisoli]TWF56960.1 fusaric acid resistance family protein [Neorhizobium alkalisoli]
MTYRSHLKDMFHWSVETEVTIVEMAAGGLAMLLPAAALTMGGHLGAGLAAAFGGMAVSGPVDADTAQNRWRLLLLRFAAVAVATIAALAFAGFGQLAPVAIIVCAGMVAVICGYSRPLAEAGIRFVLFLVIVSGMMGSGMAASIAAEGAPKGHHVILAGLVLAGAFFAILLMMAAGLIERRLGPAKAAQAAATRPEPTHVQKRARLKRSLKQLAGWHYPIRLCTCLAIAALAEWFWPGHHLHWIAVTTATLLRRQPDAAAMRASQRAIGAIIGVALAGALLFTRPDAWLIVAATGLIAALRPLLAARNYIAYSALMTPLIMLILDGSGHFDSGLLADRLIATFAGAFLVISADKLTLRFLPQDQPTGEPKPAVR